MTGFLGFVLWQSLFASEEMEEQVNQPKAEHAEKQSPHEQAIGAGPPPRTHNPTEQAIADYTRWLAVFTALLVLATISLYVSGERNVDAARKSAKAAIESADAAVKAANANVAALEISRAQIRAYFRCAIDAKLGPDNKQVTKYTCTNTGQSQARKVIITVIFGYHDFRLGHVVASPHQALNFAEDLSLNDSHSGEMESFSPIPPEILNGPKWAHRIKCTVTFVDIFNEPQSQEFEAWGWAEPGQIGFVRLKRTPFGPF